MKSFYLFLGLFLLISIAVSQSAEAFNLVPAGLTSAIEHVRKMKHSGTSRKVIADYVTKTVMNRLTFLNHFANRMSSDPKLIKKLKFFNTWRDKGNMVDDTYSAAVWAWTNRMGQCNEGASTAFHILAMAFESTDEITTVTKGDHRFVILGNIKMLPGSFSPDDLRKLDDTYIVDPWGGVSFSAKDLSFVDWFQYGHGFKIATTKYRFYKKKYDNWLAWCRKNPVAYQKWLHGLSNKAAEEKIEQKDSMYFMLDQYRKKFNELKASIEKNFKKGKTILNDVKSDMRYAGTVKSAQKEYETIIRVLVDQGKSYCDDVGKKYKKIIALSAAMEDGEALVNDRINLAKDRAATCKTEADGVFIKNNYQAAQDAFATMKTAKDAAFEILVDIHIKLEQIKKINKDLSRTYNSNEWKKQRHLHGKLLKGISGNLGLLDTGIEDAEGFLKDVQALKARIEDSRNFNIQEFPGAQADYDQFISEVSSIQLNYVIDRSRLYDLNQDYQTQQTALDFPDVHDSWLFKRVDPPLINCLSKKQSEKVMDKINEAFLRGLLVLKTSDYLRDGCKVKVAGQEPPNDSNDSSPNSPSVVADGSTPEPPAAASGNTNIPDSSSNSMGGLIISGPTEVVAGKGVTYTACDGTGIPYTSGRFSWGFSDESVISLGKSGNPVSGAGFKAGKVTIFVHYDGGDIYSGTAWLDVRIKAKENNLFGTTGGEDSEDNGNDQGDLFSSSGGEQTSDGSSLFSSAGGENNQAGTSDQDGEKNRYKNQCNRLLNNISSALDRGDTDSAQSFTNQAAALDCNIDPLILAQVKNIEKDKKEQREQQLSAIALEKERQEEECRKIRLNILAAIKQKNESALQNLAGAAVNAGCNENIAGINQIIAGIKEEKRQQQAQNNRPRQPQNQTNWMHVMNAIVKGVKDVQNGHRKPSGGGSQPLPTADSVWQSHNAGSGSNNGQNNVGQKPGNSFLRKPAFCGKWIMILKVISNNDRNIYAEKIGTTKREYLNVMILNNSIHFATSLGGAGFEEPFNSANNISVTHRWLFRVVNNKSPRILNLSLSGNKLTGSFIANHFHGLKNEYTTKYSITGIKKKN